MKAQLLCLLFLVAPALAAANGCRAEEEALAREIQVRPEVSASGSAASGDLRYLGVQGYTVSVPGVRNQVCGSLPQNFRALAGSTDAVCSPAHVKLLGAAKEYAEAYNRVIETKRRERGMETCNEG